MRARPVDEIALGFDDFYGASAWANVIQNDGAFDCIRMSGGYESTTHTHRQIERETEIPGKPVL
jgi:hypothetical protein